tara:strand:+ start:101 stop:253 length:153 start_codon:yes stop_codon:yes gene_type:complete
MRKVSRLIKKSGNLASYEPMNDIFVNTIFKFLKFEQSKHRSQDFMNNILQ